MNKLIKVNDIKSLIYELRGQKIMLDKDVDSLALEFGVLDDADHPCTHDAAVGEVPSAGCASFVGAIVN